MKVGDIVRHNHSGEILRILKIYETVSVCQHPPYSHKWNWNWTKYDKYVCALENLTPHLEGKEIFDWLDSFEKGTQLTLI